jgi:hypothetical protein
MNLTSVSAVAPIGAYQTHNGDNFGRGDERCKVRGPTDLLAPVTAAETKVASGPFT